MLLAIRLSCLPGCVRESKRSGSAPRPRWRGAHLEWTICCCAESRGRFLLHIRVWTLHGRSVCQVERRGKFRVGGVTRSNRVHTPRRKALRCVSARELQEKVCGSLSHQKFWTFLKDSWTVCDFCLRRWRAAWSSVCTREALCRCYRRGGLVVASAGEGLVGRVSVPTRGGLVMAVCLVVACLWSHPRGPRDGDL